jgi:hypothetical protein
MPVIRRPELKPEDILYFLIIKAGEWISFATAREEALACSRGFQKLTFHHLPPVYRPQHYDFP